MSEDECFVDGDRYVAVQVSEACEKCALAKVRGCCLRLKCSPGERADGRSVFWQLATSATDELTALRELNRELVEALDCAATQLECAGILVPEFRVLIAKARGKA